MSAPINITQDIIESMVAQFRQTMEKYKSSDGKVKYEINLPAGEERANLWFTPTAYAKMLSIVREADKEIGWYGVTKRLDNSMNEYLVSDIIVYPQYTTATEVKTDDQEHSDWLYSLDDDIFNNLRMHGHSHVNMACSPSGTDTTNQDHRLSQFGKDTFYVFVIWNKRHEHWFKIYDMVTNTMYENKDIWFGIYNEEVDLYQFVQESMKMVRKIEQLPENVKKKGKTKTVAAVSTPAKEAVDRYMYGGYEEDPYGYYTGRRGRLSRAELCDPYYYE